MVWTAFTPDEMESIARQLFQPCVLLINYTLLQYLVVFYWSRRRESRIALLFAVGLLGVVCLIPFASQRNGLSPGLNDVSESCCALVFPIQIAIIGRDLNKKIKFRTVMLLTRVAELIICVDLVSVLFSLLFVVSPNWLGEKYTSLKEDLPNACENTTLAFIFFFRFFYIVQSRGWRDLYNKRKTEVVWYTLFATHEVPFSILEDRSGLSWEFPQALWNRVTLAGCLYITASSKLRDRLSVQSAGEAITRHTQGRSSVGRKQENMGRRNSALVYAVATAQTASIDRSSVVTYRKGIEEVE